MAQNGSPGDTSERRGTLKRKRTSSTDEEVENMPPVKISLKSNEESDDQPAANVEVELSCSSGDESSQTELIEQEHYFTDSEYNPDSYLSPPSIPELPNCVLSPLENVKTTPHSSKRSSTSKPSCPTQPKRKCPLPTLSWADPREVWTNMCECDAAASTKKDPKMFDSHPSLHVRMRAILLDWINEVCEVYKLRRATFHLAVDYIDRYLSTTVDVEKGQLQLIGITCLFIAAKVEEVYPPKISEFAYVTDSACTADEIRLEELLILQTLGWDLTPITVNCWLGAYMQLASESRGAKRRLISESDPEASMVRGYTFGLPQYSSLDFVSCAQLVDLALLHVDINRFSNSTVAAAAVAHSFNKELALRVSGYSWEVIEPCYRWLDAFMEVTRAEGPVLSVRMADGEFVQRAAELSHICPDLNPDESHHIQSHNVTLDMFDKVHEILQKRQQEQENIETQEQTEVPETHILQAVFPPTPPASDQKSPNSAQSKTPSTRELPSKPDARVELIASPKFDS